MTRFESLRRFGTASAKWDGMKMKLGHEDFLPFSVADSDYSAPEEVLDALRERLEHGSLGYTMIDDAYLDAVRRWLIKRWRVEIEKDWIIPAPKVLTAMSVAIETLTRQDDAIVIQTPVYNKFAPAVTYNQRTLLKNPLHYEGGRYVMDLDDLEAHFRKGARMLLLCSPHNPVGRVWNRQELKDLLDLARRYDVYILSDEIHGDLILDNHTFTSMGHFLNDYEKLVVVTAPSKTFNIAGLHAANVIAAHEETRKAIIKDFKRLFLSGPNLLAQTAMKAAYEKGEAWLDAQMEHIENNDRILREFFKENDPKAYVLPLEGTYLSWVDLSHWNIESRTLVEKMKAYGVVVASGTLYGADGEGFIRINLGCSKEQLEEGLWRIGRFMDTLRS